MRWLLALMCVWGVGCQTPSPSRYVTQDQLRELLALPEGVEMPEASQRQRERVDALVLASFTAPQTPVRGAAALATADRRLAPLAKAVEGIDRAVEVCATNLANVETTAYKATYAASQPDGTVAFRMNPEQGSLQNTGRPLDVGISGQGFFKVQFNGGIAYTRNGNFFVNKDGDVVLGMGDGYRLDPPMSFPTGVTDVAISEDGRVEVVVAGSNRKVNVGQVTVCQFLNPGELTKLGGSLFAESESSGPASESKPGQEGAGQVLQGFLEGSNVDPVKERLRIRFLQNWRNTVLKALEDGK